MDMIQEKQAADPSLIPMIFVLSDGETNEGHDQDDIEKFVKELGISIHAIGYNADIDALKKIADINEGIYINADTDDVVLKLKDLFNFKL